MRRVLRSLVVGLVLVTAGCFQVDQRLTVRADGSGTFRLHMVIDLRALEELGSVMSGLGGPPASRPGPATTSSLPFPLGERTLPSGGRVSSARQDTKLVVDARFPFRDAAGFRQGLAEVAAALEDGADEADGLGPVGRLTVTRDGDVVDISYEAGPGIAGDLDLDLDRSPFDTMLREDLEPAMTVAIAGPGRIRSTNAETTDGRTATWDLLRPGAPAVLRLTTDASPSVDLLPTLLAAGMLLAVVVGGILVVRRAQVRTSPIAALGAPWPGGAPPPAPPPAPGDPMFERMPDWPERPPTA